VWASAASRQADGFGPVVAPGNDFRQHRVVADTDVAALREGAVDSNAFA